MNGYQITWRAAFVDVIRFDWFLSGDVSIDRLIDQTLLVPVPVQAQVPVGCLIKSGIHDIRYRGWYLVDDT
jgi:hypothetical protein